jgi:acid stress-induced BolA-like protein IbaG/YrbA
MINEANIKTILEDGLPEAYVRVGGDGTHFEAVIVSPAFEGKTLLQRHRLVNALLGEHINSGALHAFSMQTLTPAQWQERDA